jgi:NodT family efflux transporter outer membrane factor (OMF) lipoprotein
MSGWLNLIKTLGRVLFQGLLALTLTSCTTLGPDYESPDLGLLQEWESDLYGRIVAPADDQTEQPDLQYWWQLFQDPTLDRLIELAKESNPSLRIAGLRVLESRATLAIARGSRYPQVQQLDGNYTYIDSRQDGGPDTTFRNYQSGLTIGWEQDFWGRFQRSIESADAAFAASQFNQQNVQVLLTSQVANLYFSYRTILLRIEIAEKNAAIQKRSFEITQLLYEKGQNSEIDFQRAKTQYQTTLANIPGLHITRVQLRNALGALLARAPGDLPELDDEVKPLPLVSPVALEALPAQVLMRRPDIRSAAAQIAIQSAQVGFAQADLYPSVSLQGNLSWSGTSVDNSPDALLLGIGPSFSWNLFNYGRIKNNVRVQDARLQQTIEGFQDTLLSAARELDDAAISIVKTRESKVPQHESTVAAYRSLELANTRYKEGYESFQSVLDAQRAVASTVQSEVINDGNHIAAVISFYASLGGGWLPTEVDELIPAKTRETMQSRTDWGDLLDAPLEAESGDQYPFTTENPAK